MKNIIILALIFTTGNIAAQQTSKELTPQDPKAKAILDKVTAKNKSYSSITADFIYKLQNTEDGIDESQEGKISLKGDKYRLYIADQQIISDGKTMWTYIEEVDEVQINNVGEEDDVLSPSKLFTIYEEGFKYVYDKQENIDGKTVDVINLFPIDPSDKAFHTITLKVINAKSEFHSIIIKGKDGNTYTYILNNLVTNENLPDSNFSFDVSKVDEVIDLR